MRVLVLLTAALDRLTVPFFVAGSVASSAHGVMRSTQDIDVVAALRANQVGPLARELGPDFETDEEAVLEAVRTHWSANLFYLPDFTRIDLYVPEDTPFNRSRMARRLRIPFEGASVPVASPEDTVLKKLEWFRKGNEVAQRQWEDVLGVLRIQANRLDKEYLRRWAAVLGISDLLERALATTP